MNAKAVIGASYGDEGKGRTVDWLAAPHGPDALVVRSNGGAQAAHTVVRDGKRHVFHHIGSGSLVGARTHLSRFMVSHPILFADEMEKLAAIGRAPATTADPRGYVTTPWDMMVNQAIELARDGKRHGSCGLGFGETVGRSEETPFLLQMADLHDEGLRSRLVAIRDEWLPSRLDELGLQTGFGPLEHAGSEQLLEAYLGHCADFARGVPLRSDSDLGGEVALVFEAAQGLLLDQNAPDFPYLTRSNTGISNIAAIAEEAGIDVIEPIYVTRCYLTRHGRGPMEDERAIEPWFDVDDPTNRPNPWQESLRFGLLDPEKLALRVRADTALSSLVQLPALAVTCLDHAPAELAWLEGGKVVRGSSASFVKRVQDTAQMPIANCFANPSNADGLVHMSTS